MQPCSSSNHHVVCCNWLVATAFHSTHVTVCLCTLIGGNHSQFQTSFLQHPSAARFTKPQKCHSSSIMVHQVTLILVAFVLSMISVSEGKSCWDQRIVRQPGKQSIACGVPNVDCPQYWNAVSYDDPHPCGAGQKCCIRQNAFQG